MKYILLFTLLPYFICAQNLSKKVIIDNELEINNIDSAGTAIMVNSSGDDATGIVSTVSAQNLTKGLLKAIQGEVISSSSNSTNVYGGYFKSSGRTATGIYASAFSSNSGSTTGGYFESNSTNFSTGIKVIATSNSLNHLIIGGDFEANGRQGTGVFSNATYIGSNNPSNIASNKGGHFISQGNAGYGVYGVANNDKDDNTEVNYGGYFISNGKNGIGISGIATNANTSSFNYGGYFASNSLFGTGLFATGIYRGIYSKGRTLIEQFSVSDDASLLFSNGNPGEVIRLDHGDNKLLIGDISNIADEVVMYSGGAERININNNGHVGISESNPSEDQFHINNQTTFGAFRIQNSNSTKFRVYNNGSITVGYNNGNAGVSRALQLQNSSTLLLGTARAFAWQTYSDKRIKSNSSALQKGLDLVMKLKPLRYHHHSSEIDENGGIVNLRGPNYVETIGFFAQDVSKIVPEAAMEPRSSNDLWSMDYTKLIPVLTKAIQEQQVVIENLQEEIDELKQQNSAIKELKLMVEELQKKLK
ncbi:tail fiber domain-containing protein [Portibacter lacus]|uniref:Peptidase S74 domain-containing protein n=1 Tax=Portibacter lacus TaxID=1099794 RepID=A0AA37WFK5_9BACT|nr:tail fiber domain-containing protein [Portibacter lacus]GLR18732.1 hypothetical protein GCM10007940_33480 [Portibacter lacus]